MHLHGSSGLILVLGLFVGLYSIKHRTSVQLPSQDQPPPVNTRMISQTAPAIYDGLIVGGGPAGLSAALALARVSRTVLLFDSGEFRNYGSNAMHTLLSRDGIEPEEFRAISRKQIEDSYPHISFQQSKIVQLAHTEILPDYKGFCATDSTNRKFAGRKLILATGVEDVLPTDIEGYKENWPSHIYQCLFCDGYEQRDYPIGVLTFPNPSYAHFALMALPFNRDLTIYSNGPVPTDEPTQVALKKVMASGVKLDERPVRRLINNGKGPENGISIEFESGPPVKLGMLLHRPATRSRAHELVAQLSLETKPNGDIVVDPMMSESSVPGCIIAGDTMDSIKQVAAAVGTGVRAGAVVTFKLCDEEGNRALARLEKEKTSNGTNENL